ncbi:hypothetical protein [Bacillus sp. 'calajunan']|uniref:hypothetical protein n=1 Tax=Bacillus sp. 'calajunan' TaxID=3447457 RepID=UPI003EE11EC6
MLYRVWDHFIELCRYTRNIYVFLGLFIAGIIFMKASLSSIGILPGNFSELFSYYFLHPVNHIHGMFGSLITEIICFILGSSQIHFSQTEADEFAPWVSIATYLFGFLLGVAGLTFLIIGMSLLLTLLIIGGVLFAIFWVLTTSNNSRSY